MLSKNHPIILFIDRSGFSVYQDTLVNIPKFNFTPDLINNLDVVNKERFISLIATFIQINKIVPSVLAVILSDSVIYTKDLAVSTQKPIPDQSSEHKGEIQNFLENVPFEEVLAKVIKAGSADRITAVNRDLVMTIMNTFTSKGSVVEAVAPGFIFGQGANFMSGLTLDNVRIILENAETLKLGNLLTNQEEIIPPQSLKKESEVSLPNGVKKPQNFRQYMLVGVFVTLLVILAVVYLNLGVSQTPPVKKVKKTVSVISIPTITPILVKAEITTAPIDVKNVRIKITQSSQAEGKIANLSQELLKMGFVDIESEVSEISVPEKSSIVFSPNIPVNLRNNVIAGIKKILPDISVLENQDANFTINILIGKS